MDNNLVNDMKAESLLALTKMKVKTRCCLEARKEWYVLYQIMFYLCTSYNITSFWMLLHSRISPFNQSNSILNLIEIGAMLEPWKHNDRQTENLWFDNIGMDMNVWICYNILFTWKYQHFFLDKLPWTQYENKHIKHFTLR